jgi:hypothetical protein
MRFRTILLILTFISGLTGCRTTGNLRPQAPPPPRADDADQGARRVLLDQMYQMAVEDASSARR